MRHWLISFFAGFCLVGNAKDRAIQNYVLDAQTVYVIPVATNRVTTISFPGPISAIEAAQASINPKQPAPFLIAYQPDTAFVSVRAEKAKVATNINIRWDDQTYVLELIESDEPCLSVNFQIPPDTSVMAQSAPVTPTRLLSLLDKAKAYPLLRTYHPEAVADVDYRNYEQKPLTVDCTNYAVSLEEAFRFNPEDTLVFRVAITNKTDRELVYPRDGFELRVGERTYPESISDASGVVPPHAQTPAYFAVTGTPNGGRNDISIKNDFYVILHAHTVEPALPDVPTAVPTSGDDSPTNDDESP
jgi:hypothetical protein